jgi:3-dehydroquinate synthetase
VVIALGGGVTGDLTGFAASAWLRGIRWLNLPTTLLSMVDAGIGGKTGADLPSGKNLIGAFHPPCAVLADTTTLATLSERDIRCGLAETLKHAVIGDPELLDMLNHFAEQRTDIDWLTRLVIRSAGVKVRTILEDPFERTGRRAALNLGHTIGHAVEAASGFTIAHGEAVAIGTVAAARLAVRLNYAAPTLAETLQQALQRLGLPTEIPAEMTAETLHAYLLRDKKKAVGKVRFALPFAVGDVKTGIIIPEQDLHDLLESKQL